MALRQRLGPEDAYLPLGAGGRDTAAPENFRRLRGTAKQTIAQVPRFFKAELCMSCPISPTYFPKVPISGRHAPVLSGQRMHTLSPSTSIILFPNTDDRACQGSLVPLVYLFYTLFSALPNTLRHPAEGSARQGLRCLLSGQQSIL